MPNAFSSRKAFKRVPQEAQVRNDLHDDIGQCAERDKEDYPDPEVVRAPPDEVDDRHGVQDKTSGLEEIDYGAHGRREYTTFVRLSCVSL